MRTFAIGDIHGGLRALEQLIERIQPDPEDKFIFVGDYVDGWSESAQTIQYLIELKEKHQCVFVLGNHDLWCSRWLNLGASNPVWEEHGGKATKESYQKTGLLIEQTHRDFFNQLVDYYIDDQNRLFIHAGYTSIHGVTKEEYDSNYYFDRTLWEMVVSIDKNLKKDDPDYPKRLKHYHEIFVGHTPTTNYGDNMPMNGANVWNVDTGAAFKGSLSALNIDTKEVYQSDEVWTLYPNERGRN
ncbi:serine/threonine protein phosphatase [Paracrocinitomix mangrovi]|uniref:metallophosphoesterase family protein n=1 Tax=Paracrocinitomix mangrovi TaxID=2862509 RepID=UPI001C8DCF2C|nr:metallophosphoesterase family protein [Paracrocinitomix mangrovi]UKN00768.1 serine/threonine protein phosphatase [Paracrocinitomix mangrovi]